MKLSPIANDHLARSMEMRVIPVKLFSISAFGALLIVVGGVCFGEAQADRSRETSAVHHELVLGKLLQRLDEQDNEIARLRYELNEAVQQRAVPPLPMPDDLSSGGSQAGRVTMNGGNSPSSSATVDQLSTEEFTEIGTSQAGGLNLNTYQSPFDEGLVIQANDVAMKIGGYVKVDVIQDFNPVGDEFAFNTRTILVNAPQRDNSNIHARQSRLSFDTRWNSVAGPVRAFIEGDFFGNGSSFRLRHAYGEVGNLIVGQTWSTFANVNALPPTLDNEGSASIISQRQGQVRWTQPILIEDLSFSLAVENPQLTVTDTIAALNVQPLTESPDLVGRVRFANDRTSFQLGGVARRLGVIAPNGNRIEENAWGINFSGSHRFGDADEGYAQVVFGDGIGSYKGIPDVVSDGVSQGGILQLFGWMVGWNHRWTDKLQSSVVYSENRLDSPDFQPGDELRFNSYFATNLIWTPLENYFMGIEYLYGIRQNVNLQDSEAHRLQTSFGFSLP